VFDSQLSHRGIEMQPIQQNMCMEAIDDMLPCHGEIENAGLCKEHLAERIRSIHQKINEHRFAINLLQVDLFRLKGSRLL
jgi:hypothetical protein